ncbi:MAG: hypothetical protein QOE92_2460 [Chloroflexota bacterium]|jgi:hypothetical protein|nr:hypothetical protein [Chloroflexota bacterium]
MVEFALIFPVVIFAVFGIVEFSLMMFSVGSSRWAAAEGGRIVSEQGIQSRKCSDVAGCVRLGRAPASACDADCQAISTINITPIGTTSFAAVDEIDVQKLAVASNGALSNDISGACSPNGCINKYTLGGGNIAGWTNNYPPGTRGVTLGSADYVSVTIRYHYPWKTGLMTRFPVPNLVATYAIRLEPQKFGP